MGRTGDPGKDQTGACALGAGVGVTDGMDGNFGVGCVLMEEVKALRQRQRSVPLPIHSLVNSP